MPISSEQNRAAIGERWLERTLASYRPDAAAFFKQQQNRFANPVGQTFAERTGAIVDGLLAGADATELCVHLEEIVKIRAVQEFTPAEAVSFVFLLKDAIREELARRTCTSRDAPAELERYRGSASTSWPCSPSTSSSSGGRRCTACGCARSARATCSRCDDCSARPGRA